MSKLIVYLICPFLVLILIDCNQLSETKISLDDMSNNTIHLIRYDSFYIRLTQKIEGNSKKGYVQLVNLNLVLLDEVKCMTPYPNLTMKKDTLFLRFLMGPTSRKLSEGNFHYYSEKYKKLGFLNLGYEILPIEGSRLVSSYFFDSVGFAPSNLLSLYSSNKKINMLSVDKLNYSIEGKSFYIWKIEDNIKVITEYKPKVPINGVSLYSLIRKSYDN